MRLLGRTAGGFVLRTLAITSSNEPAVRGVGLAPLESYLRGRGLNAPAVALVDGAARGIGIWCVVGAGLDAA